MKKDILLAGVGGQGILSIAAIIGYAAVNEELYIKQSEVHGMSQRGGEVQSHVRISDKPIFSDLIPRKEADIILSMEPMEGLRYTSYLNDGGWFISNQSPFINISNYPDKEEIIKEIKQLQHHILIDADNIAKELSATRSVNMIMLGAAAPLLDLPIEKLEGGIQQIFKSKGANIIQKNIDAFQKGKAYTEKQIATIKT